MQYRGNIFSRNHEENASEFLENLEEMFSRSSLHNDILLYVEIFNYTIVCYSTTINNYQQINNSLRSNMKLDIRYNNIETLHTQIMSYHVTTYRLSIYCFIITLHNANIQYNVTTMGLYNVTYHKRDFKFKGRIFVSYRWQIITYVFSHFSQFKHRQPCASQCMGRRRRKML